MTSVIPFGSCLPMVILIRLQAVFLAKIGVYYTYSALLTLTAYTSKRLKLPMKVLSLTTLKQKKRMICQEQCLNYWKRSS